MRLLAQGSSPGWPAASVMNCLSEGGVLVSSGATSRNPMVVHSGSFIFKKQTIRGFWLPYWYQSAKPDEIKAMFDHRAPLIAAGAISVPVAATYGFDQVREAITKAAHCGVQGAVHVENMICLQVDLAGTCAPKPTREDDFRDCSFRQVRYAHLL